MSLTPANTQSTSIVNLVFAVCKLKKMDIFKEGRRFRQVRRFRHFSSELSWFCRAVPLFCCARAHDPLFDRRFQNVVAKGRPNASAPGSLNTAPA